MKIILVQAEIEQALRNYMLNQGMDLTNKKIEINMSAGRGPNGFTAELDIGEEITKPVPTQPLIRSVESEKAVELKKEPEKETTSHEKDTPATTEESDERGGVCDKGAEGNRKGKSLFGAI